MEAVSRMGSASVTRADGRYGRSGIRNDTTFPSVKSQAPDRRVSGKNSLGAAGVPPTAAPTPQSGRACPLRPFTGIARHTA